MLSVEIRGLCVYTYLYVVLLGIDVSGKKRSWQDLTGNFTLIYVTSHFSFWYFAEAVMWCSKPIYEIRMYYVINNNLTMFVSFNYVIIEWDLNSYNFCIRVLLPCEDAFLNNLGNHLNILFSIKDVKWRNALGSSFRSF